MWRTRLNCCCSKVSDSQRFLGNRASTYAWSIFWFSFRSKDGIINSKHITDAGSILRGYIWFLPWVSTVHEGLFISLVKHNGTTVSTLHLCRWKCQWLLFVGYSLHYQALLSNWSSKWRIPAEGFWSLGRSGEMALHNALASAPSTGRFLGIWLGFLFLPCALVGKSCHHLSEMWWWKCVTGIKSAI